MFVSLDRAKPLAEQIYSQVRERIVAGDLAPGRRLPSTRELSVELGVSRNTVLGAYDRLLSEGYLEGKGPRGTCVAADIPEAGVPLDGAGLRQGESRYDPARMGERHPAQSQPRSRLTGYEGPRLPKRLRDRLSDHGLRLCQRYETYSPYSLRTSRSLRYDFRHNVVVSDAASEAAWAKIMRRVLRETPSGWSDYVLSRENPVLETTLADHLRHARGVRCSADQVFVVTGPQAALELVSKVLLNKGDDVIVEESHYLGARNAFLARGARLRAVGVDDHGLRVHSLPEPDRRFKLAYVSPSHQWPRGVVLPYARRVKLLRWVTACDGFVIENDHNVEYRYEGSPVQSLQGLDGGRRVFYVGTFLRLLPPGLRVGYLVAPPSLVGVVRAAVELSGLSPSPCEQHALASFIEDGHLDRLNRRARKRASGQRDAMVQAIERYFASDVRVDVPSTGFHVRLLLPELRAGDADAVVERLAAEGIGVYPDTPFFIRKPSGLGLILGFGEMSSATIQRGVRRLARCLRGH